MPGFATHYIFGRETYHALKKNPIKKNLYDNRASYGLGLQGPDIFFYYLPSYVLEGHNIGSIAHVQETRAFFQGLIQSCMTFRTQEERDIAEAYLAGFLGHYTLDTVCHPYIYAMTHYHGKEEKAYFSRHAYLEVDIDTALLSLKLHRTPRSFHAADTLRLTLRQKRVIADMLFYAYRYAFPEMKFRRYTMHLAIFSMQLGMRILHDDTGKKKALVRLTEKYCLGYPLFSPLFPSDNLFFRTDPFNLRHASWKNPWDDSLVSSESFFELYEKAKALYISRIRKLFHVLHSKADTAASRRLLRDLLDDYGNCSFHSGLDVSIPS